MSEPKTLEVLQSISKKCLISTVRDNAPTVNKMDHCNYEEELSSALDKELGVQVTAKEIESAASVRNLSELIERQLPRDPMGRSLIDIYAIMEQFVREELSHSIDYHWHATWRGDLLNDTDSLEDVELVIRMEEVFGFSIPDRDAQALQTVGQTVRYLWQRSSEQNFKLRKRPGDVCETAFIFYELRRLVIKRGAVSSRSVRLNTRLGDLMPSWNSDFYEQIRNIFGIDLPRGNFFTRSLGFEKRTTIRQLVTLIADSTRPQR